ncbi:type II 3-dehydroquinate dehydratase (plasmid) [Agrobacterium leguminum]|uniref:3-dehydroquinate dehydratase n=1 Tax=Agrobacterium deltaense NCPPB 1641 TaxID=1183425 RepID=A0A1S7UAZ0_9HYPH|nr:MULTISPECIES: type II 3-dehydroquinate dehydratase [Agrobacterium]WFS69755.1 type II 3-dehydroquinate dehydratase [Agrobacterium leguminum]CVI64066.1 3-dehydroquinate dehydratase [Agrobacterium deltaense NCPPB 1641]
MTATPDKKPNILLIQGPNLHYLGKREPDKYGHLSAAELDDIVRLHAEETGYNLSIFYTNHEGAAIDRLYKAVEEESMDGLVMNPAGWSDSGSAPLRYCIMALAKPYVEVHIRNQYQRAIVSTLADLAFGVIQGFGNPDCYLLGLDAMNRHLVREAQQGSMSRS